MERQQKSHFSGMLMAVCLVSTLAFAAPPSPGFHTPVSVVKRAARSPIPKHIAAINSPTDFCFFLPPDPKAQTVAEAEDRAVAYCTKEGIPGTTGSKVFPPNFIVASHYKKDAAAGWVQVTGLINPTVYGMSMSDDGGQYDIKAPIGASCVGYASFVNLIEPSSSRFCMRCCKSATDCNVGISERGCERIVPGQYTLGGDMTSHLLRPESIGMTAAQLQRAEAAIARSKSKHAAVPVSTVSAPVLPAGSAPEDGTVTAAGTSTSGNVQMNKGSLNSNRSPSVVSEAAVRGVQWLSLAMIPSLMALGAFVF
ncbi:hypothetical protein BGZ73_006036 [Actinomortierella ambigua]|nr:hypothetical protein BGZ73_006033 [Actinomortierella ambigua]KAF9971060.1 hypothetical protein BGZ73_006036 [Actinomortierella ambigua]